MREIKGFNLFFVIAFLIELLIFAATKWLIPSGTTPSASLSYLLVTFLKKFPEGLLIMVTFILVLKYFSDSYLIEGAMKKIKKDYKKEFPNPKQFLRPPSNLTQTIGAILFLLSQYSAILINFYWGLFVQLTIYIFLICRRISNREENLRQMLEDIKEAGIDNPFYPFAGSYRLKLYFLSTVPISSNLFIAFAKFYSMGFGLVHEKYDFILLYLFISFCCLILVLLMLIPGFYYARKRKKRENTNSNPNF